MTRPRYRRRAALAERFRFVATPLPVPPGPAPQMLRPVNPSLEHIASWISAVGAAVALADIDGTGLPMTPVRRHSHKPGDRGAGARAAATATNRSRWTFPASASTPRWPPWVACRAISPRGLTELLVYFWGRTPVVFLRRPGATGPLGPESFVPQEIVGRRGALVQQCCDPGGPHRRRASRPHHRKLFSRRRSHAGPQCSATASRCNIRCRGP